MAQQCPQRGIIGTKRGVGFAPIVFPCPCANFTHANPNICGCPVCIGILEQLQAYGVSPLALFLTFSQS